MSIPEDAEKLYTSLFNSETEDQKDQGVIDVTIRYDNSRRLALKKYYDAVYAEKSFDEDIKSQLSGHFYDLVNYLYTNPIEYDCLEFNNSINKITYNTDNVYELVTARPKWFLDRVKEKYNELYKQNLPNEIEKKIGGIVGKRLKELFDIERTVNKNPDPTECEAIAKELSTYVVSDWVKEDKLFNYFATKSPEELILIGRFYYKITGMPLTIVIEEKAVDEEKLFLTELLYNACRPAELFSKKIKTAIHGLGTDTNALNRIAVTRNEIDTTMIRKFYKYYYRVNLQDDVVGDTSGGYQTLLCELFSK